MRRTFLLAGLIALCSASYAQPLEVRRTLIPEQAQQDLNTLVSLLHEAHPDPFRYTVKGRLDSLIAAVNDSLVLPVTVARLRELLMPVFHAIGDAGCRPEHPAVKANVPLLPLEIAVLAGNVHVVDETKGFRSIPRGSRIISINGIEMEDILQRIHLHIVADGANETLRDAIIGPAFPQLYHNYVDASPTFKVQYAAPDGSKEEVLIMGLTQVEAELSRKPKGIDLAPWTSTVHPNQDALWLSVGTLDPAELDLAGLDPAKYLKGIRKEIKRKGIRELVIDVRHTAGDELAMAELIHSFIAIEPFRVVQDMSVRSPYPPEHYSYATPQPEFYSTAPEIFVPDPSGAYRVRPDDHRLELVPPVARAYMGKVHVVCNGGTRGAAAAFVMLAKRYGRARIVGEEVGANALGFTGGRTLEAELPHSGISFTIPLIRYMPDGTSSAPPDRGEMPHHTVVQRPEDLAKGRDTVKAALLALFMEMR